MTKITEKTKAFFDKKADDVIGRIEKTPSRNLAIATLIIISGSVLFLSYFRFQTLINAPFLESKLHEEKAQISAEMGTYTTAINFLRGATAQQQLYDTDGDGITDSDEENIYGTNPFLSDSDSDGISDTQELASGTDPNCAEGTVCETILGQEGEVTKLQKSIGGIDIPEDFDPTDPEQLMQLQEEFFTSGDLSAIGITDPVQEEFLQQAFSQLSDPDNLTQEDRDLIKEQYAGMTTDDLRELLLVNGLPQEEIDKLTEEQLEQALKNSLSQF